MNQERLSEASPSTMMDAASVCPACFSWQTFDYPGGEFRGCHLCGTIAARDRRTTAVYDAQYVALRYDRYPTTRPMSILRYRIMMGVLDLCEAMEEGRFTPRLGPMLDVGYGNGDFIRYCIERGWDAYGNDVNPTVYPNVRQVPLPDADKNSTHYRVVTFFDALEHFEDHREVRWVSHYTDWIIASFPTLAPEFPYKTEGYKHYRPGEHHMYFEPQSLERIFSFDERVARVEYVGCPEDSIRGKRRDGGQNITTVALRCYDA
jgi:hypothetical protein